MIDSHKIMVAAGHRWYSENADKPEPEFSTAPRAMPGAIFTDNDEADELNDYMVKASENAGCIVSPDEFNRALVQLLVERERAGKLPKKKGTQGD